MKMASGFSLAIHVSTAPGGQVELVAAGGQDLAAFGGQAPHDGGADHAAMAGDPDALAF
jgi:hypothetical protein